MCIREELHTACNITLTVESAVTIEYGREMTSAIQALKGDISKGNRSQIELAMKGIYIFTEVRFFPVVEHYETGEHLNVSFSHTFLTASVV
jgi:hypothetical protein